ncbi:MAG TPA: hypothetical protein VL026_15375 [Rhizomicrobium sp.]|nr:hypothetical protein [Rhizomicrobium sp.]
MTQCSPRWFGVCLIAAAIVLILPLWVAVVPAMPDYPAHLASYYLIAGGASRFYDIVWAPIPNLAGEILVPLAGRWMAMDVAAKLFLSLGVAFWVAGPALIQRALYGRAGFMALAATVFAYNVNFMWGFLNYYFAAGLCLVLFGLWISSAGLARAPRLLLFCVATLVLYFCHILSAALFLLLIATYEVTRRPVGWRMLVLELAALGVPVAVLFLFKPVGGGATKFKLLDTLLERFASLSQLHFGLPATFTLLAFAVLFAFGLWRGIVHIHPRLRLTLIALGLLSLLVPETAMGGWGLHLRFPAVFAVLLFAASSVDRPRPILSLAMLALLATTAAGLASYSRAYSAQVAEFRQSLRLLPEQSGLLTVIADGAGGRWTPIFLYWHIAEYSIMDRGSFTSLMFATPGQHVVVLKPAIAAIAANTAKEGSPPNSKDLLLLQDGKPAPELWAYLSDYGCHYRHVALMEARGQTAQVPRSFKLRHRGSFFALYDVARPAACSVTSAMRP